MLAMVTIGFPVSSTNTDFKQLLSRPPPADGVLGVLMAGLAKRQFSSLELTRFFLEQIDRCNPQLNCFISVTEDYAVRQARRADHLLRTGQAQDLTGIPYAHKDIFCTREVLTSCASKSLHNFYPPYDATVSMRLQEAGMVMLGKTNMDEFAMGSSSENSYYGAVKNPWQHDCVAGGSSGGSAAAVAAALAPCATGTDTGGSIRQPAALCGLTGLKPSYGRVSRYGMVAYASSLDQAGVLARSASDCARVLKVIAGFDARDSTSVDQPVPDYPRLMNQPVAGLRVGLPAAYMDDCLNAEVRHALQQACSQFEDMGLTMHSIDLPHLAYSIPTYYIIAMAEASSNLSRYDGVHYGYRCADAVDLEDLYQRSRSESLGPEVQRRIMLGTYVLSAGYQDKYYLKAQRVRRKIRDDFQAAFEHVDIIAGPVSPTPAFRLGEKSDPVAMYLADVYTTAVNLAGLPGLTVPAGFSRTGLPIGIQLIAPYFAEDKVLALGHAYQQCSDWHHRRPPAVN